MSPEPDTARELKPVVMFDDEGGPSGRKHRDFPPISKYVQRQREQEANFVKPNDDEDGEPETTSEPAQPAAAAEPELAPEPDPEPGDTPEDAPSDPPESAPEPDEAGGDETESDDDIPSPWDAPTSD